MEREGNQVESGPTLCRLGCGFFGSPNTDGLCSKCYKDHQKKKQSPSSAASASTTVRASTPIATPSQQQATSLAPMSTPPGIEGLTSSASTATALPTVQAISLGSGLHKAESEEASSSEGATAAGAEATLEGSEAASPEKDAGKKKKNKCHTCKKKVGLTGFNCRCGGLYCAVHRYSNEHRCTFDYRELGAEEIRRNNPVIKGEKIQKI